MPTSVEVGNLDADFIVVELGNWFAEFIKKINFFQKSIVLVNFSSNELDNWFAEFTLNSILKIDFKIFLMHSEVGNWVADFTSSKLGNGFAEFTENSIRLFIDMKLSLFIDLKILKNYRNTFSSIKIDI